MDIQCKSENGEEKVEETILSSSFTTVKSTVDNQSVSSTSYSAFCEDLDETINSTMIENFNSNIEISPSQTGSSKNKIDIQSNNERSMLVMGSPKSVYLGPPYFRPIKSFWMQQIDNFLPKVGFHQKDDIFQELHCNSCSYTTFRKKDMTEHIRKWHKVGNAHILPSIAPGRSTPIQSWEIGSVELGQCSGFSGANAENVNKPLNDQQSTRNQAVQAETHDVINAKIPTEERKSETGFHMKDPVSREYKCNTCGFESFSKKQIIIHVDKHIAAVKIPTEEENVKIGFHMKDPVSKELKCNTCGFESFSNKQIIIHVDKHKEKNSIVASPPLKEKENKKSLGHIEKLIETAVGSNQNIGLEEKYPVQDEGKDHMDGKGFHIKDVVSKELKCDRCGFEVFSRKKMVAHVEKKHGTMENVDETNKISKLGHESATDNVITDLKDVESNQFTPAQSAVPLIEPQFMDIVLSSSLEESDNSDNYPLGQNNRKRVHFDEEQGLSLKPKRRMLSPEYHAKDDSF